MASEVSQPAAAQANISSSEIAMASPEQTTERPQSRKRARSPHNADEEKRNKWPDWSGRGGKQRGRRGRSPSKQSTNQRGDIASASDRRRQTGDGRKQYGDNPNFLVNFSKEEIENESRRPKKKVVVMIGYSGSGYKGMQLNGNEKTIESDLFKAFVAAGAVSKANADDPKKSALVRCARTDKGVHAAGNVISMKLIVEDKDIVQKINSHLSPQIRVWGIEQATGSFSAYQACDSRIYEYLIPTHCFVPPHPRSFLAKKLVELAEEAGDTEGYRIRQGDALSYWEEAEEKFVKPVLDTLDPELARQALQAIFETGTSHVVKEQREKQGLQGIEEVGNTVNGANDSSTAGQQSVELAQDEQNAIEQVDLAIERAEMEVDAAPSADQGPTLDTSPRVEDTSDASAIKTPDAAANMSTTTTPPPNPLEAAIRDLKSAYVRAKLSYRLSAPRLARVQSTLSRYVGTHRFHNYTIHKSPFESSAKRHIKSFVVSNPTSPIIINGVEWLSLKVHGQSFMMHQIRKMVSMAALVVRCGTHEGRIQDSFLPQRISIPRAPGLGLLLERPIFQGYNDKIRLKGGIERGKVVFDAFEKEIEEFKQREIYERIWREEEKEHLFLGLFGAVDMLRSAQLLYLSSGGLEATKKVVEGAWQWKRRREGGGDVDVDVDAEIGLPEEDEGVEGKDAEG